MRKILLAGLAIGISILSQQTNASNNISHASGTCYVFKKDKFIKKNKCMVENIDHGNSMIDNYSIPGYGKVVVYRKGQEQHLTFGTGTDYKTEIEANKTWRSRPQLKVMNEDVARPLYDNIDTFASVMPCIKAKDKSFELCTYNIKSYANGK